MELIDTSDLLKMGERDELWCVLELYVTSTD
jgi:hypothetical protein